MSPAVREGIVVLGAPRSGTTLVRRILDAHPAIACPPETTLFSACARFLHEQPLDNGVRFGVLDGLCQAGFPESVVLERLRELAFGFHREHAGSQGKLLWAEKTAADVFHLPAIERLCAGHVYWVGVLRHGLDVALSLQDLTDKAGGYLDEIHTFVQREPRPLVAFTEAWAQATEALLDLAERRDDVVLLRYEDLVADPITALEPMFSMLEQPLEPALVARAMGVRSAGFGDWKTWSRSAIDEASVGRYRSGLSRHLKAELAERYNPLLQRAGYPAVKIPRIKPHDAKRRMDMAMRISALKAEDP